MNVMVGGVTADRILERFTEGQVVIVPADRSEVHPALVTAHQAPGLHRWPGSFSLKDDGVPQSAEVIQTLRKVATT